MRRHPLAIAQLVSRPASERRIGPFVLLHQLGHGGFAPVWAARETYDGTDVRDAAVKLFALGRQSHFARDRLVREAQALCRVDHPHVVRFYSLVIDEPSGVGALAMELVAGQSLGRRVHESGPLSPADVLQIGTAVSSALAEVHRAGLLHRDVKPDNVVEATGSFKLIDFGIAFSADDEDETTAADDPGQTAKVGLRVTGTPGFVAPEYLQGEAPNVAGELFALGATLHTCLVGCPPAATTNDFPWNLDPDILEGRRMPPSLAMRAPRAPGPLIELIERLIAPDPRVRPPSASWVAERLEAMTQESSRRTRVLPPEDVGPFRGLGRFEAADRDVFFGREGEIGSVLELLRRRSLVVLMGPSGSGKSSLARAGVLPRIAEGGLERWPKHWDTAIVAPGPDPRAAIMKSITMWLGREIQADVECVVKALEDHVQHAGRGLLFFVDPLEELITLEQEGTGESRRFFVELLVRLGDMAPEGIKVLGATRRDLLDSLLALPSFGKTLARSFVLVEPLPPSALRDVLSRALDAYGYTLEDEVLVDELLAGVGQSANAMPLVAFALTEAWRMRDAAGKRLTRAGLLATGGVRGALEKHAEATLTAFAEGNNDKLRATRRILLGLTTLEGTRTSKNIEKLRLLCGNCADELVRTFVEARLFVPVDEGITLAHEALITQWPRLASWMEEARGPRQVVAELERAARFWKTDPDVAPLIRGARLERFQNAVHAAEGEWLSDDAWGYLTASLHAARARRRWIWAGLVSVSLVVFGAALGWQKLNTPAIPVQTERVLQASSAASAEAKRSAEPLWSATPLPAPTAQEEVVPVMSAKTLESSKRGPLRNAAPRGSESPVVQEEKSAEKPMASAEKLEPISAPTPIASGDTEVPAKPKTRFRLNRPE